jgi:HTH-type transcriptional regulator/antitoxin HipB
MSTNAYNELPESGGIKGIGAFIRERRQARQMTQADLAALAGVTRALVIAIEQGKPTLRVDGVERVLNVFGRTIGAIDMPEERRREPAS